jgi:holo-[acyl-carrier protein] synthase
MFTGWRRIPWRDIEITGGGPPGVNLYGKAKARAELLGITDIKITITHTGGNAMVFVISQGEHA